MLREQRWLLVAKLMLVWIVSGAFLYVLCFAAEWVRRGFKDTV